MRFRPVFFFWVWSWLALGAAALVPATAHAQDAAATVTTSPAPRAADDGRRMGWFGLGVRVGYTQLHLTPPSSLVGAYNSATGGTTSTSEHTVDSTGRTVTPTLHLGGGGFFFKMDLPITFAPLFRAYGIGLYPINFGLYLPRAALFPYGSFGVASSIVQSRSTVDPFTSNKIIGAVAQVRVAAGLKYFPMHALALSGEVGYSPWAAGVMLLPPGAGSNTTRTQGGFGSVWDFSLGVEWL
ncbi:MAG: hypothetical protein ABUS79_24320 [Pseudomonadota bacterium]